MERNEREKKKEKQSAVWFQIVTAAYVQVQNRDDVDVNKEQLLHASFAYI